MFAITEINNPKALTNKPDTLRKFILIKTIEKYKKIKKLTI